MQTKRALYQGQYRSELEEEVTTPTTEPGNLDGESPTTPEDDLTPEEKSFKKRYSDLRSYNLTLTERVKSLENQLQAAQKQEIKLPATKEEVDRFAHAYPDVFRYIRSIAMNELLQERENISLETKQVKDELEQVKRDRGYQKILGAHPDFNEINLSEQFHEWAQLQPKQIQDWLFESSDPDLCIKALDLFKVETKFNQKRGPGRPPKGADMAIPQKGTAMDFTDNDGKKIWKASEIAKLHPKHFEKFENEIEQARAEGRIDMSA